ncbi:MAG: hypothetical protein IJZ95_03235 [Oscillospiraceae bacterium]|nr:hypothetical protein [Oscillospiraceae bacterium]
MSKTKTVDLVERSLEKDKKDFITMCKVFQAACIVFAVCAAALVAIVLVPLILMGADMLATVVFIINALPLLLGFVTACNFGWKIFGTLKNGESPFRYDIADKVKGAAFALLGSGFIGIIIQPVSYTVSEHFSDIGHYFSFASFGCCVMGAGLGVAAYIMNYGCKLQQESDETL